MNNYWKFCCNWRVQVLVAIAFPATILLLGESDDMGTLIISKAAGLALAAIVWRLGKHWVAKGRINIDEIANER